MGLDIITVSSSGWISPQNEFKKLLVVKGGSTIKSSLAGVLCVGVQWTPQTVQHGLCLVVAKQMNKRRALSMIWLD